MGGTVSHQYDLYFNSEVTPFPPDGKKSDPLYGFENGRKEKVMKLTDDELASAGIRQEKRDYCAHLYLKIKECYNANFPWAKCDHEVHEYQNCLYKEWVDSHKDYERERRLLLRQKRIEARKAKEGLVE